MSENTSNCIYCGTVGAITTSGVYVCGDDVCRQKHLIHPGNNAVVNMYRNNAPEVEFLIKCTFATANSKRGDMIFNPFPWMFKSTGTFEQDPLGEPVPKNRYYDAVLKCMMPVDEILKLISECDTDAQLMEKMSTVHSLSSYHLIKWIIETKNIETEFSELVISHKQTLRQFKIKHDPSRESAFTELSPVHCHLFHGSAIENWHSIIRNGIFNASNTKLMTAGAAYGNGVYLSDNLLINSHYSKGHLDDGKLGNYSSEMVIAVFQVAASKETYQKGVGIFVVPDASKLLLRYLIIVPRTTDLSALSTELAKKYENDLLLDKKISVKVNSRTQVRITSDLAKIMKLSNYVAHQTISPGVFIITCGIIKLGIQFTDEYPFEPPIMWIQSPFVSSSIVLPSGTISHPTLLRNGWKPTTQIVDLIKPVLDTIEIVTDGEYDTANAIAVAINIRK